MEFVGNKINGKGIAVTLLVTFFVGRIQLFEGTFPAAIALITVMLAVSTIYIYLVPVLAVSMATYLQQGTDMMGDLLSIVFLGMFFLFFHQRKFSINQRTVIAIMSTIACQCFYYKQEKIFFLLQPEMLVKEAIAIMIYIRVFNLLARILYTGTENTYISQEKTIMAMMIAGVSVIGALGNAVLVFPLWILMISIVLLIKGVQPAIMLASVASVFWLCQGETKWELFIFLFAGILAGWYGSMTVDIRYKKPIIAASLFTAAGLLGGMQLYGIAFVMMLFLLIPQPAMARILYIVEERFMPELSTENDLQYMAIRRDLMKKREAFLHLGNLYSRDCEGKEIISYQFMGMARTLEHLLDDISGQGDVSKSTRETTTLMPIKVGQASYAFEQVSGDSMDAFAFEQDQVALIISDGMGKGCKAAGESHLVVSTLSRLLQAGFDVDLAMKTINGILMTGNADERFATVDLAILDRKKNRAKIFKMGAATTFIKHDGSVSMLKKQALPAGITQGLKLEYIDIKLKRGDILIMVSDGVTDCDRKDPNCDWLRERLLEIRTRDPETIAELIVNKAAEKYGIHERDDLTVMAAAIGV